MKRLAIMLIVLFLVSSFLAVEPSFGSPTDNSWVTKASMPQAIAGCSAAVYDGKIFVIGGSANYMYDPITDNWTAKTPMPTPRMFFAIAVVKDAIYCIGGRDSASYSLNEVYYPATDSWETKKSLPVAASDMDANTIGQKIYVIWGSANFVYYVSTDSWINGGAVMPYPVSAYASALFDGKIYFFGGADESRHYVNYTQIYNPTTNSWTLGTPITTTHGPENCAISAVATSGSLSLRRIYVLGGWTKDIISGSNLNRVYNPENDSWASGALMPTGRVGVTLTAINDTIFAIGGSAFYVVLSMANEQYYPFGYGTPDTTSTINPPSLELSWLVIVPLLLFFVFLVALVYRHRKSRK